MDILEKQNHIKRTIENTLRDNIFEFTPIFINTLRDNLLLINFVNDVNLISCRVSVRYQHDGESKFIHINFPN